MFPENVEITSSFKSNFFEGRIMKNGPGVPSKNTDRKSVVEVIVSRMTTPAVSIFLMA
jgi:hypothetical protein